MGVVPHQFNGLLDPLGIVRENPVGFSGENVTLRVGNWTGMQSNADVRCAGAEPLMTGHDFIGQTKNHGSHSRIPFSISQSPLFSSR